MKKILIFGFGYTAKFLAKNLPDSEFQIIATRSCDYSDTNLLFNSNNRLSFKNLSDVTHVLVSIPPVGGEDIVYKNHVNDLEKLKKLEWVGYLSATNVYGDHGGQRVDEKSRLLATGVRGKARIHAESCWMQSNLPWHIFRLSGIYGLGRSIVERLNAGERQFIFKEDSVFSRIHVSDIAQILLKSINSPSPKDIYNLSDDYPCNYIEVVKYAARKLNIENLKFVNFNSANISNSLREFYLQNKIVLNSKIKKTLNLKLLYPSYKDGIDEILSHKKYSK